VSDRVTGALAKTADVRGARERAQTQLVRYRAWCSLVSMISVSLGLASHKRSMDYHPEGDVTIDIIKSLDTVACLISLALVFQSHRVLAKQHLLAVHLVVNTPLSTNCWTCMLGVLKRPAFWVEAIISIMHVPPTVTFTFGTVGVTSGGGDGISRNYVLYRAENLFSVLNVLKIYQLWPMLREGVFWDLPRRHLVARMTQVSLGSTFALKRMLNSKYAVLYVGLLWLFWTLVFAVVYRNVELTACLYPSMMREDGTMRDPLCAERSAYIWVQQGREVRKVNDYTMVSAIWAVFVTSSTVGYGDYVPTTELGRAVMVLVATLGIMAAGLLTATTILELQWTATEQSVLLMLERQKARRQMRDMAARLIATCWVRRTRRLKGVRNDPEYAHNVKVKFRHVLELSKSDTEKLGGVERKIATVSKRTRDSRNDLDRLVEISGMKSAVQERRSSSEHGNLSGEGLVRVASTGSKKGLFA